MLNSPCVPSNYVRCILFPVYQFCLKSVSRPEDNNEVWINQNQGRIFAGMSVETLYPGKCPAMKLGCYVSPFLPNILPVYFQELSFCGIHLKEQLGLLYFLNLRTMMEFRNLDFHDVVWTCGP